MSNAVTTASQAKAEAKFVKGSQQKVDLVLQMIRGKSVHAAVNALTFSPRRAAKDALKTLNAAIANAENNQQLDIDSLVVKEAYSGKSMVMRRFHARGRGRGARVIKPYSRMTIIVEERN